MSRKKREAKAKRRRLSGRTPRERVFVYSCRAELAVEVVRWTAESYGWSRDLVRAQVDEEGERRELVITLKIPANAVEADGVDVSIDVHRDLGRYGIEVNGEAWGECMDGSAEVDFEIELQSGEETGNVRKMLLT